MEKERLHCTIRINPDHDDKNLKFFPQSMSRIQMELHHCLQSQNWKYIAEIIEYGLCKIEYTHQEIVLMKV